jgi:hypothetical protein
VRSKKEEAGHQAEPDAAERLETALAQFAAIAHDLKSNRKLEAIA